MLKCKVEGCSCEVDRYPVQQLCNKHYNQLQRHGKILRRTAKDPNEIVICDGYAEVILYNRKGNEVGRSLIDIEDIPKIKSHKWHIGRGDYVVCGKLKNSMHRLIMDCPDDLLVDHINHNRLDNRKSNLRLCTSSQNNMNRVKLKRNTSGHTGVCFKPRINKWQAYITVNKHNKHLGYFTSLDEAIAVRREAEIQYFGEYRNTGEGD